jgi:RNA polymerase-binding protein DksA
VATGYAATPAVAPAIPPPEERGDPHLRSTKALIGYYIGAKDGDIGHVQDFIIDDKTWAIRYMVVDTVNWWPGKKVVIAPQWIERVSWEESKVFVDLSRERIKKAPEYNPTAMLSRQYEDGLYAHYRRSKYWDGNDAGHVNEAFSLSQFSGAQPPGNGDRLRRKVTAMDKQKLNYFRDLLLEQLRTATEDVRADQATALQGDDGVKDTGDMSELDVNKSTGFNLGGRQLHMVQEIDQALLRIEEGTYGQCGHCGKPIDDERLKAMPSAKYDAECQVAIEATQGIAEMPTL